MSPNSSSEISSVIESERRDTPADRREASSARLQSAAVSPAPQMDPVSTTLIESRSDWRLFDLREMLQYRDLLYFLTLRDITVLYKQTVLGVAWAVLNPFFSMVVFTVIFGMLLRVPSDGRPYAVFSFAALLPWNYFSQSLSGSTNSLIQGANLFTKVYFPRVFIPLVPVFSKLVDFAIASVMLAALMAWYRIAPTTNVVFVPLLLVILMMTSAGIGMLLSALAIQFRDIRHAMNFMLQILMYAAPVVWPVSKIPHGFRLIYGIYPMAGVIEGFRSALLGTGPMPWDLIAVGSVSAAITFLIGALYFRRTERFFADVA